MYPELIKIGPITIHSFGLMAMLGFLITTLVLRKEFARKKIDPDMANSIAVAAVLGGFIGARLYFIIEHWQEFLRDPFSMIFSGAGLVWYGGLIGGVIAVVWTLKRLRIPIMSGGDSIAPLILLGYGIGRLGCQLAGDGDYGPPTDLPWAMHYTNGVVPTLNNPKLQALYAKMYPGQPIPADIAVHPTPLYDFLLSMLLFFMLWKLRGKLMRTGQLFGLSMIALGFERFVTEFFRMTPKIPGLGITHAQTISILMAIAGGYIWYLAKQRDFPEAPATPRKSPGKKRR